MKELEDKIELRFYEIGKRIAEFDQFRDTIIKTQSQLIDLKNEFSKFKSETILRGENLEKINSSLAVSLKSTQDKIDLLNNKIELLLQENKKTLSKAIDAENTGTMNGHIIQEQDKKIVSITNQISRQKKISEDLNGKICELIKCISDLQKKFSSLPDYEDMINTVRNEIHEIKTKADLNTKETNYAIQNNKLYIFDQISIKFNSLEEKIKEFSLKTENSINYFYKQDKQEFATKQNINEIKNQLDNLVLDVKNALLKAGNNEMQNNLNLKKLENIQLLLKHNEFSK